MFLHIVPIYEEVLIKLQFTRLHIPVTAESHAKSNSNPILSYHALHSFINKVHAILSGEHFWVSDIVVEVLHI